MAFDGFDPAQLVLRLLNSHSEHPLAQAIVTSMQRSRTCSRELLLVLNPLTGKGLVGTVDGKRLPGNAALMESLQNSRSRHLETEGGREQLQGKTVSHRDRGSVSRLYLHL